MNLPSHIKNHRDLEALKVFRAKYPKSTKTFVAYKYVASDREPPLYPNGKIYYFKGTVVSVKRFNRNKKLNCGSGINVATRYYAYNYGNGYLKIRLEVRVCDVVCIPDKSGGKFRTKQVKVLS